MTVEEALAASVVEPVNDIFEINPETRVITVPASEKLFGVANDGNSERKHFRCPKIAGDNIDLSTMHLYINYQNANGDKYPYLVEDVQTDGDYITYSWLIGPDVVAYKGQIKFIVCAKKGDGTIPEWNTTIAEGTVLEGLEATDEVVDRNPDIIEQILTRLDNVTEIPQEKVTEAVSTYMEANPINVPKNLSDLKDDAEHRTVTDTEKQSWDNKSDFDGNYESLTGKPTIPTVPAWAKEEEKPTYTASEVGALPDTTEIPKNLSDLQDDSEHRTVTDAEKQSWNDKSNFSGNYEDLKGKPTIPTVPTTLPNPKALTIMYGGKAHTYDGNEAIAITIKTGGIERIEKLATDTTVILEPNKLYIFPEMASLTYTIGEETGEVHFIFKSGATATRVVHPSNVNIGSFTVDANKVYEVSILEGLLTSQNWSVS
ncbi:MAG: hypothetical protein Q3X47_03820 [Dorea sp.]|jgi:hypothetical protein|uniref:hypothetical protein n=1 Tax=Dorea sp. TaxID=2040332 RepID=UPI002849B220|nr:hypothetical protein [Dorea sp.]MDR3925448.1 hypothetical protein [Dorea sp.]